MLAQCQRQTRLSLQLCCTKRLSLPGREGDMHPIQHCTGNRVIQGHCHYCSLSTCCVISSGKCCLDLSGKRPSQGAQEKSTQLASEPFPQSISLKTLMALSMITLCSLWCRRKRMKQRARDLGPFSSCTTEAVWPWTIHIIATSLNLSFPSWKISDNSTCLTSGRAELL